MLVALAQFVSTTVVLTNLDDNATAPERFQPVITCAGTAASNANSSCFVRFDFAFVRTGTSTPVNLFGLSVGAQDVDGNGTPIGTGVREFIELTGASSVNVTPTSTLVLGTPVAGGVRYVQPSSADVQAGIGTGDQYQVFGKYANVVTGLSIIGGNFVGSAGCLATNTACQRQNSYTFIPADNSVPSVTVRKISIGGTATFAFTGTNGWVTQTVTTTAIGGAGTDSQSEALIAPNVATTITESAPFGYSLTSIVCSGLGAGTATPTINGTAGGSVLLSAAATAVGNNVLCTFSNRKLTATLTISKSNGTDTVAAGQTTAYTITASNTAGDNAQGAVVRDPEVAGLSCTSVICTGAACPAAASVTVSALQSPGITLGSFPAGTSVSFVLTCGVTATGQ